MWGGLLKISTQLNFLIQLLQEQNSLMRELIVIQSGKAPNTRRAHQVAPVVPGKNFRKKTDRDVMVVTPELAAKLRDDADAEKERQNNPSSPDLTPNPQP